MSNDETHPHLRLITSSSENNKLTSKKNERAIVKKVSASKSKETSSVFSGSHFVIIGVFAAISLVFVELLHTWDLISAFIHESNGNIDPVKTTGAAVIGSGGLAVIVKAGELVYRFVRNLLR